MSTATLAGKELELDADYHLAHFHLGNIYSLTGQFDQAYAHYQKMLELMGRP